MQRGKEQVHLRDDREVLEDLDEQQEAVDRVEVLHLLEVPHQRLQVQMVAWVHRPHHLERGGGARVDVDTQEDHDYKNEDIDVVYVGTIHPCHYDQVNFWPKNLTLKYEKGNF